MNLASVVKAVRAYDATEWEIFISEWQKGLQGYHAVKRLGGAGDHGRDVIGLVTPNGCEGVWDNYQCKHYEVALHTPKACEDAGKIIFHAYNGVFTPPRKCSFVAPRGVTTELRDLLLNPGKFKVELLKTWDVRVAKKVVSGQSNKLEGSLLDYVNAYDFTSFSYESLDEILDDHRRTAYWASRFNGLLPPAPPGVTPTSIDARETVYVAKLLDVYREETGQKITSASDLVAFQGWADDFHKQRVRFYEAEAFMAHYRDQTEPGTIEDFADQILDAIEPSLVATASGHSRLSSALSTASQVVPASVLAPRAKPKVKQGVCHQLANMDRITWKVNDGA